MSEPDFEDNQLTPRQSLDFGPATENLSLDHLENARRYLANLAETWKRQIATGRTVVIKFDTETVSPNPPEGVKLIPSEDLNSNMVYIANTNKFAEKMFEVVKNSESLRKNPEYPLFYLHGIAENHIQQAERFLHASDFINQENVGDPYEQIPIRDNINGVFKKNRQPDKRFKHSPNEIDANRILIENGIEIGLSTVMKKEIITYEVKKAMELEMYAYTIGYAAQKQ